MNQLQQALQPKTLPEAFELAERLSKTDLIPPDFRGKPEKILIAIQIGAEIGLAPLQSIQNIAVINGRPTMWGDAILALLKAHPDFEDIIETFENQTAKCTIKRKNQTAHTVKFSLEDAEKAGLLKKTNTPWSTYPKRMCQMRARGFCARDTFPDALKGLLLREEVQDYKPSKNVESIGEPSQKAKNVMSKLGILEEDATQEKKYTTIQEEQLIELKRLIKLLNIDENIQQKWLDKAKVSSFEELESNIANKIILNLKAKIGEKE